MNKLKNFSVLFLTVFLVASVSAIWPLGGITGNVVVNSNQSNSAECIDYDLGTFADVASGVYARGLLRNTITYDSCKGSKQTLYYLNEEGKLVKITGTTAIREYYCSEDGKRVYQDYTSGELGQGLCIYETSAKGSINGDFPLKAQSIAKWISIPRMCVEVSAGVVRDETGRTYTTKCSGNNYVEYSCNENRTEIVETKTSCPNKCSVAQKGCFGTCAEETDTENNKDVGGSLKVDGKEFKDVCVGTASVKQYTCANNALKTLAPVACGTNRICVDGALGAYCKDLYASADLAGTVSNLSGAVGAIDLTSLDARIDALNASLISNKEGILGIFSNTVSTGQIRLGQTWINDLVVDSINGSIACGSNSCLFGYMGLVLPNTTHFSYDNHGIVPCNQLLNFSKMKETSDWVEGSKVIIEYLCAR